MLVILDLVTFFAGLVTGLYFGWEAFRVWAGKIDTRDEAMDFIVCIGMTLVGICVLQTAARAIFGG